jgi:Family of unknown function (DUF6272)
MEVDLDYIQFLSKKMRKEHFILSYRGHVSHEIIKSLLSLTEKKLELDGTIVSTKKKVFNVMVECLQNISHHSEGDLSNKDGLFMIGKTETQYIISSGNLISNSKIEDLTNKLTTVNKMNKEELSELYKKMIVENRITDRGNAGLGIIDMAKKSGGKLDYTFVTISDKQSYFTLKTVVHKNPEIA